MPNFSRCYSYFLREVANRLLKNSFHCSLTSEHYNSLRGAPLSSLDRVSLASINIGPAERIFKWGGGGGGS